MAHVSPADVLRVLAEDGALAAEAIADVEAKVASGSDVYDLLVGEGVINGEVFAQAEAKILGLPYVDLHGLAIPNEVLGIIPQSTAREHSIIAYETTDEECKVAMRDASDRQIVEFIQKKVDKHVSVALASRESIQMALAQYQVSLEQELAEILKNVGTLQLSDGKDLSKVAEELPTIRMIDLILKHAILQGASDIHIEPTETKVIVRYRIDGILHDMLTLPRNYLAGLVARIKVLGNLKIDEHRLPQDGRFKIETDDYKIAFRVSFLPVFDGEKVVMRLLDESGKGLSLESIGMRASVLEAFRRNINKPHGMVLVTGPTGSGKTTTLYAAMKELNTPEVNISTIEDPIEYRMARINQTQVNPQIGMTFSNGLRALVRQDPDILMVGEIRDEETASLAINAALTGHLVLSTLHTNSAAGALPRLLDMNVEAFLLGSTVNLLVAQRLVRRLCKECKKQAALGADIIPELSKLFDTNQLQATLIQEGALAKDKKLEDLTVYTPVGCKACTAGYKGRAGIYEALEFTDEIRAMITAKTSSQELEKAGREFGHLILMLEDGFLKVAEGATSVEEVLRVANE